LSISLILTISIIIILPIIIHLFSIITHLSISTSIPLFLIIYPSLPISISFSLFTHPSSIYIIYLYPLNLYQIYYLSYLFNSHTSILFPSSLFHSTPTFTISYFLFLIIIPILVFLSPFIIILSFVVSFYYDHHLFYLFIIYISYPFLPSIFLIDHFIFAYPLYSLPIIILIYLFVTLTHLFLINVSFLFHLFIIYFCLIIITCLPYVISSSILFSLHILL